MTAKTAALLFGLTFLAVGLLGFIDNPIIGTSDEAIFHADTIHNIVHIASGALFLLIALAAPGAAATVLIIFGLVYLLLGILGFVSIGSDGMTTLLGFLHVNGADNYLHIGLGVLITLAGIATRGTRTATNY